MALSQDNIDRLQSVVDRVVNTDSMENLLDEDSLSVLGRAALDSGFTESKSAFLEQFHDRPLTTLIRWIIAAGS